MIEIGAVIVPINLKLTPKMFGPYDNHTFTGVLTGRTETSSILSLWRRNAYVSPRNITCSNKSSNMLHFNEIVPNEQYSRYIPSFIRWEECFARLRRHVTPYSVRTREFACHHVNSHDRSVFITLTIKNVSKRRSKRSRTRTISLALKIVSETRTVDITSVMYHEYINRVVFMTVLIRWIMWASIPMFPAVQLANESWNYFRTLTLFMP